MGNKSKHVLCVVLALMGLTAVSCFSLHDSGMEGARCFSNGTCIEGLECNVDNVCARPPAEDGGTDGGKKDGGVKDGSISDGGPRDGGPDGGNKDAGFDAGGFNCSDYGGNVGWQCIVPAGTFHMGCNIAVDSECEGNENPYHDVTTGAYKIDKYEVTAAQYKACVDASGCTAADTSSGCNYKISGKESHPINCVDWNQAKAYCAWAGKRLPTEAEWEKAARGTDGRKYPWGNTGLDCDHAVMSVSPCSNSGTAQVGSKPAGESPYGVMDMMGNVYEWVEDDYHVTYNSAPANGNAWVDTPRSLNRTLRGGSWYADYSYHLRSSIRGYTDPMIWLNFVGIRCSRD